MYVLIEIVQKTFTPRYLEHVKLFSYNRCRWN